jgi:hypothetical protein
VKEEFDANKKKRLLSAILRVFVETKTKEEVSIAANYLKKE